MSIVLRQIVLLDKKVANEVLYELEQRVLLDYPEFLNQDITIIIQSLAKLGQMPKLVI